MTENSLSLNIVHEPFTKRSAKSKAADTLPPEKGVFDTGPRQKTTNSSQKVVVKRQNRGNKMTVWKALKGKDVIRPDETSTVPFNKPFVTEKKGFGGQKSEWKTTKLFAGNPEVPSVPYRAVQPIKEPVFSSKTFKDVNLHPFMVKTLEETLELPCVTAVQERLIPVLLSGQDALVRSQTGSGKTLAFAVPLVQILQSQRPKLTRGDGVKVLVIAPSRELALQIHETFLQLTKSFTWLVPGILMGGERRKAEKARLRKGITILTCTPGRLLDHINHTDCLNLKEVKHLVLDEADRMLDMGYEQDVAQILEALASSGSSRQTVLLSATLSAGVERLAGLSLKEPVRVDVVDVAPATVPVDVEDIRQDALILPGDLSHSYIVTPAKLRLVTLAAFILDKCMIQGNKVIVFMATQDMVDLHTALFPSALHVFSEGQELELTKLHGSMAQQERTRVFIQFRKARSAVLLCTDVAARGLDLPEVDWVVQYNGPASIADYVHRVGRTARRGLPGAAVLFLATTEVAFVARLESARVRLTQLRMEDILSSLCTANAGFTSMQEAATKMQAVLEGVVEEEVHVHDLACKAYTSWVRFYASYPRDLKECFSVKATHLGHFAKSFALKEPPTVASRHAREIADKNKLVRKRPRDATKGPGPKQAKVRQGQQRRAPISEFDSGLEPLKKRKTR